MSTCNATIGDVTVIAETNGIVFRQNDVDIHLDADGLSELMDYLFTCSSHRSNRRRAFRVPLFHDSGLMVRIILGENVKEVTPLNLSTDGIAISYAEADPAEFTIDRKCYILLNFEGELLQVLATVRRADKYSCSFQFVSVKRDRIALFVMELQRQWLQRRMFVS